MKTPSVRPALLSILLVLFTNAAFAAGLIKGTVVNEQRQPVISAIVSLIHNGRVVSNTNTDVDGRYEIRSVKPGRYAVKFVFGKATDSVLNIIVSEGKAVIANGRLNLSNPRKKEIPVISRRPVKRLEQMNVAPGIVYTEEREMLADKSISRGYFAASPTSVYVPYVNQGTEDYKKDPENDFRSVKSSPLSTLSVDVDRASYSNVRRFINQGQKPPVDAVRIEEMINYFDYNYPQPKGDAPVAITTEVTACPWNPDNKLLHIGIQARKVNMDNLPPSNLVFLIDVSGSMSEANKLPLLKASFKLLVDNLREKDHVAIVVYAGNAGLVLPSTAGNRKATITEALDQLSAGGSTAGGQGVELAYKTAEEHFIKGGNNRIILATDGDFNVGVSNNNELEELITKKRTKGIFLTCLGFGMGNYKDSKMEVLADKGNGNYAYIDNIQEARKTLVSEFGGTLFTVAKDVKAQVEFNPAKVQGYRLVGYENRLLNAEDFKDDTKDAGDMGAGHTVTILYEIIPTGVKSSYLREADDLKYQQPEAKRSTGSGELATVKFRYKAPDGHVSKELVHPIGDANKTLLQTSENIRFAASVAMWGMLLKDSKYKGKSNYNKAILLAESARGKDPEGYRAECIRMMKSIQ